MLKTGAMTAVLGKSAVLAAMSFVIVNLGSYLCVAARSSLEAVGLPRSPGSFQPDIPWEREQPPAHEPDWHPDQVRDDLHGESEEFSCRRKGKPAKKMGTTALKIGSALAVLAALGQEIASYYQHKNEGTVTSLEFDENMELATTTLSGVRAVALAAIVVGGVRYLYGVATKQRRRK